MGGSVEQESFRGASKDLEHRRKRHPPPRFVNGELLEGDKQENEEKDAA